MKVFCTLLFALAVILHVSCEPSKKSEGDFEFADDGKLKVDSLKLDKRTWISDPESNLCKALKCRRKERCLLEDDYTAVCVSKEDIVKNGDIVVPRQTTTQKSAKPIPYGEDALSSEYVDDDAEIIDAYDEDIDLDAKDSILKTTTVKTTTAAWAELKKCTPCPVIKPTYICGTDNQTYSSLCKLDYYNCMHNAHIAIACKGFCPCNESHALKKQQARDRLNAFEAKYFATMTQNKANKKPVQNVVYSPEALKYKEEVWGKKQAKDTTNLPYWGDKSRQRGENDVLSKPTETMKPKQCSSDSLKNMGNRMLDWFSIIMTDGRKDKAKHRNLKNKVRFPVSCPLEVQWMFGHLNRDADTQLSLAELYSLEHDEMEPCMRPFLDRCDTNKDMYLTGTEWCQCFGKSDRPCMAMKKRTKPGLLGAYMPSCDNEGFFHPRQCHSSLGLCWCVDKHGTELENSRIRGKPDCEALLKKSNNEKKTDDDSEDEDDLDDSDDDDDFDGSAAASVDA